VLLVQMCTAVGTWPMNASLECRVAPIGLPSELAPIALVSASCTRDERLFRLWSIRSRGVVPHGQWPRAVTAKKPNQNPRIYQAGLSDGSGIRIG
jgi:hypothetical protein